MSIVYTADVFCDDCATWTRGASDKRPPLKWRTRCGIRRDGWIHSVGKDYCPACATARGLAKPVEKKNA
jgi:hypothetical protein